MADQERRRRRAPAGRGGTLAGVTQAGSTLRVKVQLTTVGGTTTLRTKVWPTGTAEPAAWRVSASDSQAALQAAGEIGFNVYANGSVSNGPLCSASTT